MPNGVPKGWGAVLFTDDQSKAVARAKAMRSDGKKVKVGRHSTKALSGRAYTEYIVLEKKG